jgi:hypothetical protein
VEGLGAARELGEHAHRRVGLTGRLEVRDIERDG